MRPGVTFEYETPSGWWLTETELDCIGLELKGNWKREQSMWIRSALHLHLLIETNECIRNSPWKMI